MATVPPASGASLRQGACFAFSFLSRLWPPCDYSLAAVAASLSWFPLVGLVIGLLQTLPFIVFDLHALGDARGWLYAALGWWLTRGLHWDGLMDIADAWGSNARGERFWEICKDSRVGAFAVLGAVVTLGLMASLANACLDRGLLAPLVLAPVAGRSFCLILASMARPLARPGMGTTFLQAATLSRVGWAVLWPILLWLPLAPLVALLWAGALMALLCWRLLALGRSVGGVNGDFLGAGILCAELAVLAGALL